MAGEKEYFNNIDSPDLVSLGNYVEKFGDAGSTTAAGFVTIPVPTPYLNQVLTIIIFNGASNTRSVGIRTVGSLIARELSIVKDTGIVMNVKTDGSGNFEFKSDGSALVQFKIIS